MESVAVNVRIGIATSVLMKLPREFDKVTTRIGRQSLQAVPGQVEKERMVFVGRYPVP